MVNSLKKNTAAIILAAGLGTRMKSDRAKVLHCLQGRPMILYVVESAAKIVGDNIVIVTGHQAEIVRDTVSEYYSASYANQDQQLGTGHAVQCALSAISPHIQEVIILCGDVPLISIETLKQLIATHQSNNYDITLLTVNIDNPTGYGRIIVDSCGMVQKIVEEADATNFEKNIHTINTGIYALKKNCLLETISLIRPNNKQKEYYLTDIIEIGKAKEMKIGMMLAPNADEVIGINSQQDLASAERLINKMKIS